MKRHGADDDLALAAPDAPPDAAERKRAKAVIAYRVDLLPKVDVPWWGWGWVSEGIELQESMKIDL